MFFKKAFPTSVPSDFADEQSRRDASLAEPGRFTAFRRMAVASKIESERRIPDVTAPILVLIGSRVQISSIRPKRRSTSPDLLNGTVVMLDGAGHHPQIEMPDAVAAHLVPFMQSVDAGPKNSTVARRL